MDPKNWNIGYDEDEDEDLPKDVKKNKKCIKFLLRCQNFLVSVKIWTRLYDIFDRLQRTHVSSEDRRRVDSFRNEHESKLQMDRKSLQLPKKCPEIFRQVARNLYCQKCVTSDRDFLGILFYNTVLKN